MCPYFLGPKNALDKQPGMVKECFYRTVKELKMKMQEVRAIAKFWGLKDTFGLSKTELIRRIQRAEGNFDCFGTATDYCDQSQCCFREDCLKPSDH